MKNNTSFTTLGLLITFLLTLLFITACDTTENTNGTLALSFSKGSTPQKPTDDIQLNEVKILLRDIKLERESDDDSEGEDGNYDKDCEYVKVGPFVVNLNINGPTTDFVVNYIPAGIYDELEFKIHKPKTSETSPDPEFKDGDDNSLRYSVIVKGVYNLNPFVYKSRKSVHQELEFEKLLVVEDNTSTNLTITVDPYTWFYKEGVLLDPTNPANESEIDNNIEHSFKKAFEDDDHDGDCDDD